MSEIEDNNIQSFQAHTSSAPIDFDNISTVNYQIVSGKKSPKSHGTTTKNHLPVVLLSNIQSFDKSGNTDKKFT